MVALGTIWKEGRGGGRPPCRATIVPYFTRSQLARRGALQALLGLCALLLVLTACGGQEPTQTPQPTHVALPPLPPVGTLAEGATSAQPVGPIAANRRLQLTIGLAINRQGLADDLAALYDPTSPRYGHFLTPDQITSRYGAPQAAIDTVTQFLNAAGIQVDAVSSLRDSITVSATAAQIQQAFHISLQLFELNGRNFFGPTGNIQLPGPVSQFIDFITGLSNFAQPRVGPKKASTTPPACNDLQGASVVMPGQIAAAYNYTNVYKAGYTGKGMAIGVVEFNDNVSTNDLNTFLSCTTGGKLHRSIARVNGGARTSDEDSTGEATLDFEYLSTLAPDANLIEYQTTYCNQVFCDPSIDNFPEAYANILNQIAREDRVQVVSASWGGQERFFSQDEIHAIDKALELLAVEGITFTAASGDCGAYDDGNFGRLSVDYPAADPYALAVGGTLLATNGQGQRTAEPAWSNPKPDRSQCQNDWGTGGGLSVIFPRPFWQTATNVQNPNSTRELPDVSAISLNVPLYFLGNWYRSGGTSLASPVWAAGIALVDQGLRQHNKPLVGAPPTFYHVANQAGSLHPFYDVTQGNNLFYQAKAGFDLATGLGAPNLIDFGKALGAF